MLLTWVLVINGVRVLADNQVFSICLLQHMSTVVGMLIAHLYGMLVMIRAEEKIIGKVEKVTMKMEKGLQLRSIDGEE